MNSQSTTKTSIQLCSSMFCQKDLFKTFQLYVLQMCQNLQHNSYTAKASASNAHHLGTVSYVACLYPSMSIWNFLPLTFCDVFQWYLPKHRQHSEQTAIVFCWGPFSLHCGNCELKHNNGKESRRRCLRSCLHEKLIMTTDAIFSCSFFSLA